MSCKTVYRDGHGEIEVKKSRFIAVIHPIASEEDASSFISDIRKKYRDARHHCYAFTLGPHWETQRSSDDGEPSGTAGRPILELLLKEEIHDAILVVTRYFGGTLLGTGGLLRAYTQAAGMAVDDADIIEKKLGRRLTIVTDYSSLGKIQSLTASEGAAMTDTRYTDVVETDILIPAKDVDIFSQKVCDATSAGAKIHAGDIVEYALTEEGIIIFE